MEKLIKCAILFFFQQFIDTLILKEILYQAEFYLQTYDMNKTTKSISTLQREPFEKEKGKKEILL